MAEKPKMMHVVIPAIATILVALIGLFTAIYQSERPFQQTAAALAQTQTAVGTIQPSLPTQSVQPTALLFKTAQPTLPLKTGVPAASPTAPATTIQVSNKLHLPVRISIDSLDKGEVESGGVKTYLLDSFPVTVKWSLVKETTVKGRPLGPDMGGSFKDITPGDEITIDNQVEGQAYFYPIITNSTAVDCEVTINKGWESEFITNAVASANSDRVGLGYYLLFTNSNVTLDCGGHIYWWGAQPDEANPDSIFNEVEKDSGVIEFTLKP